MPSTQAIKHRIGSVKNTRQITRAMELVAASKLRKAQEAAQRSELYAKAAREVLSHLKQSDESFQAPLYEQRPVRSRLFIVVSSDRGLAGAYNTNVLKMAIQKIAGAKEQNVQGKVINVGRKAGSFMARIDGIDAAGTYDNTEDEPDVGNVVPIVNTVIDQFLSGEVDAVEIIYTDYVSNVTQSPVALQLLPAGFESVEVPQSIQQAEFEPSAEEVLEVMTKRLIESQVLQAMLAAKASEQAMRRTAMHNATENASELVDDLTLEMNKARQASITQELAEITGGAEAIK